MNEWILALIFINGVLVCTIKVVVVLVLLAMRIGIGLVLFYTRVFKVGTYSVNPSIYRSYSFINCSCSD